MLANKMLLNILKYNSQVNLSFLTFIAKLSLNSTQLNLNSN